MVLQNGKPPQYFVGAGELRIDLISLLSFTTHTQLSNRFKYQVLTVTLPCLRCIRIAFEVQLDDLTGVLIMGNWSSLARRSQSKEVGELASCR